MKSPTEFVDHMRLVRQALSHLAASGKNGVAAQLMRSLSDNVERDLGRQKQEMASSPDGSYQTRVRSVTINSGKDGIATTFSGLGGSRPGRGDASVITIDLAEWDSTAARSARPLALDDVPTDLYLDRHAQLGHELCHALANQLGLTPESFVAELMTVGLVPGYEFTENRIRQDMAMPTRRSYTGIKADENGTLVQATSRDAYLSMTRLGLDPGLLFKSLRVGADRACKEKSPELRRAAIERVQSLARQVQPEIHACGWRNRGIDDLLAVDTAGGDLSPLATMPPDAWWTFTSVESVTPTSNSM